MEEIKGRIERVNPKGLKIEGRWYNYSKYMEEEIPEVSEGDEVRIDTKGDWIMGLNLVSHQPSETSGISGSKATGKGVSGKDTKDLDRQVVITRLACLNTATEILKLYSKPVTSKNLFKVAEELESWVWRNLRGEDAQNGEAIRETFGDVEDNGKA